MSKKNNALSKLKMKSTKETPEARKKRVSSGVKFRPAVFDDKRRKLQGKNADDEMDA